MPPLARKDSPGRPIDFEQNQKIVDHIRAGGIRNYLYGGNAFLYHVTLGEYEALLDWLNGQADDKWMIPSAGPSYGRAMDQAPLLRKYGFSCTMLLPCSDPRDADGLEQGLREFADAAETKLILYLKEESNFGKEKEQGLDVVGRLVDEGICVAIKYAVVRENPAEDKYLKSLLRRVDKSRVVSGIGERPAVVHMRDWGLPGFTTGSGCIAPALSQEIFEACSRGDFESALQMREKFIPLEDLRDLWGPAVVLHAATEEAKLAATGPVPPFVSGLNVPERAELSHVAAELLAANSARLTAAAR